MGHRGWCMRVDNKEQAAALRRWYVGVEDDTKSDWGLRFISMCRRDDGSIWALINSDGSGCVHQLPRYGYKGDFMLLGEDDWWDSADSPLGKMRNAAYSAYFDAEPHEFFKEKAKKLEAQYGFEAVVPLTSMDEQRTVYEALERLRRQERFRLIPERGSWMFRLTDGSAEVAGYLVRRMTPETLEFLSAETGLRVLPRGEVPGEKELRSGYVRDGVVELWDEDARHFSAVPMKGATPEQVERACAKTESEQAEAAVVRRLRRRGYGRGALMIGGGCKQVWFTKSTGVCMDLHPNERPELEACYKNDCSQGAPIRTIEFRISKSPGGRITSDVVVGIEDLEDEAKIEAIEASLIKQWRERAV